MTAMHSVEYAGCVDASDSLVFLYKEWKDARSNHRLPAVAFHETRSEGVCNEERMQWMHDVKFAFCM